MTRSEDRYEAEVLRWAAAIVRERRKKRTLGSNIIIRFLENLADLIWKRPPMEPNEPMYKVWEREEAARIAEGKESGDRRQDS